VRIVVIAGQTAAPLRRLDTAREDGDAIPTFLAVPDRTVAGGTERGGRKPVIGAFSSCRQTMSGALASSQPNRLVKRPLTPFTL